MSTFPDDQIDLFAPNVVVRVATPPPYSSQDVHFSATFPQTTSNIIDFASPSRMGIGDDRTSDLAEGAISIVNAAADVSASLKSTIRPFSQVLVKEYTNLFGEIGPDTPTPTTTNPEPISSAEDDDTSTPVSPLPKNLPFDESAYNPEDLMLPPALEPGRFFTGIKDWTPLERDLFRTFNHFPSAIYIPAISSYISTPYFSPAAERHRNGVMGSPLNVDPENTTYLWESHPDKDGDQEILIPRPNGSLDIPSRSRDRNDPLRAYLDVGKWEKKHKISNGDQINAFSLILGIMPGEGGEKPQAAPWKLTITFGGVTVELVEGRAEVEIDVTHAKGSSPPRRVMIKPSAAPYVTENFGPRPYLMTFIPVWNGLLISDGIPGSSDWGDSVRYFPKDLSLDVNALINDRLTSHLTQEQVEQGKTDLPPNVIVYRGGPKTAPRRWRTPGVFIDMPGGKGTADVTMGKRLKVDLYRCGAALKFVPVMFPQFTRYHYLYPGSADIRDTVADESPKRKKRKPPPGVTTTTTTPDPSVPFNQENPFEVKTKSDALILPIFNFSKSDPMDLRTNIFTLIRNRSKPYACVSMEFKSVNRDLRRPIQVWGAAIYDKFSITQSLDVIPPVNGEGQLSLNDLPEDRILRVSVSRALDGAQGEITWDLNDPVLGVLPRPTQNVGAVRIAALGGANTVPGVIFTGIALGNSRDVAPDENTIRLPLRGRESKLDADGGIVLINAPYFDGFDHRDAMAFLANYGGVPIDTSYATPFRLISSVSLDSPILDFPMGTGVNQAMETIAKEAGNLYFFDRYGTLIYIDAETSTGRNWSYPDANFISFSDEPDFTWVRNEIIIYALVAAPGSLTRAGGAELAPTQVVMVRVPVTTIPAFPWSRQAVYTIPQIVRDTGELTRLAARIARGIARPRATSRCVLPGNAAMELLDLINGDWIVTSISHDLDLQSKSWTMNVGVELFVSGDQNVGTPELLPLTEIG